MSFMTECGVVDIYETDFGLFEVGPGLAAVFRRAREVKAMPSWRLMWLKFFRPRVWSDAVIKAEVIETAINDYSAEVWQSGRSIRFADYETSGLRFEVE